MNLIGNMVSSADSQNVLAKMDVSGAKDQSMQMVDDSQQPQMFDRVLSDATAVEKPESKASVAKPRTVAAVTKDSLKSEDRAAPDIALLMSLMPVLPLNIATPATDSRIPSLPAQDDAIAAVAISPAASGRAVPAPTNPAVSQTALSDVLKSPAAIIVAAALQGATIDSSSMIEGRITDKADFFASILATIESPAVPAVPMLAVPTQQAPTMTAVALALPVTAPGVLDEMPITNGEWPAALGHRLLWAVGEGMQKVEISVNPQDMGPIKVHIRIENDKTDIRFTAVHALTRDALEASIPRLRDMFSQQGLNLSQAQVFSQTSQDTRGRQPDTNQPDSGAQRSDAADAQETEQARPVHWRRGLVDDYA
jgi:flagellar hook-length control protein FliK